MTSTHTVADRIRLLRDRASLSQGEVARRVNVNESTVSLWERGLRAPGPANLRALAKLYGTPWQWIKDGDGSLPGPDVPDVIARLERIEKTLSEVREQVTEKGAGSRERPTVPQKIESEELLALVHRALASIAGGVSPESERSLNP